MDSGSELSLLPPSPGSVPLPDPPLRLRAANGTQIAVYELHREEELDLGLGRPYHAKFVVAAVPEPILGADFLQQHGLVPDLRQRCLTDRQTGRTVECTPPSTGLGHPKTAHISSVGDHRHIDGEAFSYIRTSQQFTDVCVPKHGFPSVKTPGVMHRIVTKGNPVFCRPRRLSPEKLEVVRQEINELLERGIIEPSSSQWSSPIHLVQKDGGRAFRLVGCYERLNALTVPDRYPVPDIQTFTDQLAGARIFSTIDLARAYAQVPLYGPDKPKSAITTPLGLYQYTRMPFGLRNSGQTFQRLIDHVLQGMPRVFAYIDDILLFSPDVATHQRDLQELFSRLSRHGLVIRPEKCVFGRDSVVFLGLEVSAAGARPTPDRVTDLINFPPPSTVAECRRYIGMINFYHRFVPDLARILRPLHDLANSPPRHFNWSKEHAEAFQLSKSALAATSQLAFPRQDAVTQVSADASNEAVGAVVQQYQDGRWVPIAYHSKKFSPPQLKWSTGDKELFAIFSAVKRFRHLLEGRPKLRFLTDHKPLIYAFTSKTTRSSRVERQLAYLSEFSTDIRYVRGSENVVPDYLSRPPQTAGDRSISAVSGLSQTSLSPAEFADAQSGASDISELVADSSLNIEKRTVPGSTNPLLVDTSREHDRVLVPESLQRQVFHKCHNLSHPSANVTRRLLSERFVFKGLASKVRQWARNCLQCQRSKVGRHQHTPLSRPPTPSDRFAVLHVDIIGPLPESDGCRYAFTIVDRLTRYPDAIPMQDATSQSCARALLEWISRFGMCVRVTSDRGRQFISELWKELWKFFGVDHAIVCAYMPQQNGIVERMHRQLKASLIAVLEGRSDWTAALPLVLLGMRASFKPDLGTSAAQLVLGEAIRLPGQFFLDNTGDQQSVSELERSLRQTIRRIRPTPTSWHTRANHPPIFLSPSMEQTPRVFVRVDGHKRPLQPHYKGPYLVLQRGVKAFLLDIEGKADLVSVDRLKPAFMERPEDTTLLDPTISIPTSRFGRKLRSPQRFQSHPQMNAIGDSRYFVT